MKTITRKELYDKIWSINKTKTAAELNLKLADLTKICLEHNIPTPSSNYWQRLSWGLEVKKTPLPNPQKDKVISLAPAMSQRKTRQDINNQYETDDNEYSAALDAELVRTREEQRRKKLMEKARAGKFIVDFQQPFDSWMDNAEQVINLFPVPRQLTSRREIIFLTKTYFRIDRLGWSERVSRREYEKLQTHLNINASENLQDRSLRIFDTLISIYEALGGKMKYEQSKTYVILGGVEFAICIAERKKRIDRASEGRSELFRYDYVPSGSLSVKLDWRWRNYKIEDTDYSKIEDKIDVLIKKTLSYVKEDMDWREQQRLDELERQRKEEVRRLEEEHRRQLKVLKDEERNDIRRWMNLLRREMIVDMIDNVLMKNGLREDVNQPSQETQFYVTKLLALRNLFSPRRSEELETHLTESDIDSLADEFFSGIDA